MTAAYASFHLAVAGLRDGVLTLVLAGALDYDTSDAFTRQAGQVLDEHPAARVLRLDCAGLLGIDSMGLSTLLALRRRLDGAGTALHLTARPRSLERLLTITGTLEYLIGEPASPQTEQEPAGAESRPAPLEGAPPQRGG
ncbi:STAS domain-containing protein [Streptomyces sp. NPDC001904]|uniref:STAS domain-containing protein n=1 Tax=Streptomyces sp. NPDC001904 TaxID=3154531 RepID=UPI00332D9EA3